MNADCRGANSDFPADPAQIAAGASQVGSFFQRSDWLSFGITTLLSLLIYLLTLAPEVGLDNSGVYATGASYGGVAPPPGYPLWTLWAWMFIHLLPFANIAWRVGVSSAAAGALSCGVIALMVSRGGAIILESTRIGRGLKPKEEQWLRAVCGYVAGMVFGLNGAFWPEVVKVAVWPVSILSLGVVLCLLMRWSCRPEARRYLYAAAVMYGLTLTNSQIELAFAPAIPFLLMMGDRRIGRDMFLVAGVMLLIGLGGIRYGYFSWLDDCGGGQFLVFVLLGAIMSLMGIGLVIWTRRAFLEWQAILSCGGWFILGLLLYLYLPIASMKNPPVNWGYPRTVEGFFHVVTRGQYEKTNLINDVRQFFMQVRAYYLIAGKEFGWFYLLMAAVPFCFLHRLSAGGRRLILALLPPYVCLAFLMLAVLNPSLDMQSLEIVSVYFSASYIMLALGTGYGLMILGSLVARSSDSHEAASA